MKDKMLNFTKKFWLAGYFLPVIGIMVAVSVGMVDKSRVPDTEKLEIITVSNLMKAIDVSELATSEFIYNGIAEVYDDRKTDKVEYYIRYDARIRAGIDIKNVDFNIDHEECIIEVILPEIEIFTPPIIKPESLSYIPSEKQYDLQEVLQTCEADVLREAEKAEELKASAIDSLKAIIEALLKPIIEPEGYSIVWNE